MTTRFGGTKLLLASGSFLTFSALTAFLSARGVAEDTGASSDEPAARRILILTPDGAVQQVTVPLEQPQANSSLPAARSRGS